MQHLCLNTELKGMDFKHIRIRCILQGDGLAEELSILSYHIWARSLRTLQNVDSEKLQHWAFFIMSLVVCFALALPSVSVIISTEHITIRLRTHSWTLLLLQLRISIKLMKQIPSRDWLRQMSKLVLVILPLEEGFSGLYGELSNSLITIPENLRWNLIHTFGVFLL